MLACLEGSSAPSPGPHKPSTVEKAYNHRTWEAELGVSRVQDHPVQQLWQRETLPPKEIKTSLETNKKKIGAKQLYFINFPSTGRASGIDLFPSLPFSCPDWTCMANGAGGPSVWFFCCFWLQTITSVWGTLKSHGDTDYQENSFSLEKPALLEDETKHGEGEVIL